MQTESDRIPKFSILMPTYNQAHYIGQSIESVLNQTLSDWELVICDDGSTDNTPQVIEEYLKKDSRVRYVRKSNGGTGSALNGAFEASHGNWICWLSSDDLFAPEALEIFDNAIKSNQNCKFFHAHYYILNDLEQGVESPEIQVQSVNTPPELQVITLLEVNHFNGITICIKREALSQTGKFNEGNRNGQDYEMWLRLSLKHQWVFIPQRVSYTRLHANVGQIAFPLAGVFDSAAAAQMVINEYPFEAYFPLLDLKNPEHAWRAILAGLQLSIKTSAFIYQGLGPVPAFIERMLEWISKPENSQLKENFTPHLQTLIPIIKDANLPETLYSAIIRLVNGEPFQYKAYDPFEAMHKNIFILSNSGRHDEAQTIYKYLVKVNRFSPELIKPG